MVSAERITERRMPRDILDFKKVIAAKFLVLDSTKSE
jgi:hypothetical protein